MSGFHLKILNIDRLFFEGEVDTLVARTVCGDVGIKKGHADLIAALDFGVLRIKTGGEEKSAAVSKGMLVVDKFGATIITNHSEWEDEIDIDRAVEQKKAAERELERAKSKHEHDIAEFRLKRALNRISSKKL